jgi:TonB family protein
VYKRGLVFIALLALSTRFATAGNQTKAADSSSNKSQEAKHDSSSDEVFAAGGDVKPPKVIHYVEPEFSPSSSREAYVEGVVRLSAVVNTDGVPVDLRVTKRLNANADNLAIEALKQWRFKPGTKNDRPVKVRINVEINFHLL